MTAVGSLSSHSELAVDRSKEVLVVLVVTAEPVESFLDKLVVVETGVSPACAVACNGFSRPQLTS